MSRIFIDRPIFAWVIAIIIMLVGLGSIFTLPVEQFPDVAPPQVNIRASYPGASAETLENSVTQVIEQQLTGIDGLLYFSSNSSSRQKSSLFATALQPSTTARRDRQSLAGSGLTSLSCRAVCPMLRLPAPGLVTSTSAPVSST